MFHVGTNWFHQTMFDLDQELEDGIITQEEYNFAANELRMELNRHEQAEKHLNKLAYN
jgi:hypothetical protein